MERNPRAPWPVLCLVTDRTLCRNTSLADAVDRAVAGGVTLVQVREKDLPTRELLELTVQLLARVGDRAQVLVNGRADVAFAAGAGGVHLPADGLPTAGARVIVGEMRLVGRSVHSAAEVAAAAAEDLDYFQLGTIFPSRSHPGGTAIGLRAIERAAPFAVPLVGIGGIDSASAGDVIRAGAAGVAVISAILSADDPYAAAGRLREAVQRAWDAARGAGG